MGNSNVNQLKIISDGTTKNTQVFIGDKLLGLIQEIDIHIDNKNPLAEVVIKTTKVPFEIKSRNFKIDEA